MGCLFVRFDLFRIRAHANHRPHQDLAQPSFDPHVHSTGSSLRKTSHLERAIFSHSAPYSVAGLNSRHDKRALSYYNIKSRLAKTRRGLSSHLRQPRHSFFPVAIQPLE
jgi:hypothetical protein